MLAIASTPTKHAPTQHDLPPPVPSPMDLSESRINAQVDARVHQIFEGPAPQPEAVEEPDLPDAEDDEPDQYDPGMDSAFAHLLQVIDQPVTKDAPSLSLTTELYSALSNLSHTDPWSSLTFDLKALLPELDRRFHIFLVAGLCLSDGPTPITTGQIFNNLLYTMAKTITDILAPPNSDIPLPDVHSVFFTQFFFSPMPCTP